MRATRIDTILLGLIVLLVIFGSLVFVSAAFGILARGGAHASSVVFNHLVLGVGLGALGLMATSMIDYRTWRTFAPHLYVLSLIATALVFVPHLGFEHGGGRRWIEIMGFTFQPSETMKIGAVLCAAAVFATMRDRVGTWQGLAAFVGILALPAALLVAQPDIGTLGIIVASVFAVYLAAGARGRDVCIVIAAGFLFVGTLAYLRPYMLDRVTTFINPAENPQSEGYQITQSLIAIGSGGVTGRGFGQGVQKFTYLPEPMGDSIFAVAAEETGFIGGTILIGLFLVLALRGFTIASRSPDMFGALAAIGITCYFVAEAFINIGSMLGLAPLTGVPLTFISQGGSAMLVSLASAGILLNISRRSAKK